MMNRLNFSDKLLPSHSHARTKIANPLKKMANQKNIRVGGSTALEITCTLFRLFITLIVYIASTAHPERTNPSSLREHVPKNKMLPIGN